MQYFQIQNQNQVEIERNVNVLRSSVLFPGKLLVEFGNIVVPFSLVKVSSNRLSQMMLFGELTNGKFPPVVSRTIGQSLLVKVNLVLLLIYQEDVAVEASALWGTRSDILGQRVSFRNIAPGDVTHKPMMPFSELGILS